MLASLSVSVRFGLRQGLRVRLVMGSSISALLIERLIGLFRCERRRRGSTWCLLAPPVGKPMLPSWGNSQLRPRPKVTRPLPPSFAAPWVRKVCMPPLWILRYFPSGRYLWLLSRGASPWHAQPKLWVLTKGPSGVFGGCVLPKPPLEIVFLCCGGPCQLKALVYIQR